MNDVGVETLGPDATEALGTELAAHLVPGDVVLLSGDLGTGKTTLVRGAARALGVTGPITSPTFAIGHRYPVSGPSRPGLRAVGHLDLYRLAGLADEDPDLLADYVGSDLIAFVEWPGVALDELASLARIRLEVALEHAGEDRRRVRLHWREPRA